ncbi:hypothetical protein H4R99_002975 [Coemansia sp. RSA 1722]|nr:hypothetical protein H4R99_002975 [Coemansia sp. RSA 1722]
MTKTADLSSNTALSSETTFSSSPTLSSKGWFIESSTTSVGLSAAAQGSDGPAIQLSTHILSPLTLQSDDIVELVVSHAQTPVGLGTPTATSSSVQPTLESSTSVSQTTTVESSWVTTPAAHELFELAEPTDPTNTVDDYSEEILPKRLFRMLRKRGLFAYKSQEDESEDAARSARSLLSVMREIATRSENSSPKRQSQISAIRSVLNKQMIYPDDVVLDDDDSNYNHGNFYNPINHNIDYHFHD